MYSITGAKTWCICNSFFNGKIIIKWYNNHVFIRVLILLAFFCVCDENKFVDVKVWECHCWNSDLLFPDLNFPIMILTQR